MSLTVTIRSACELQTELASLSERGKLDESTVPAFDALTAAVEQGFVIGDTNIELDANVAGEVRSQLSYFADNGALEADTVRAYDELERALGAVAA